MANEGYARVLKITDYPIKCLYLSFLLLSFYILYCLPAIIMEKNKIKSRFSFPHYIGLHKYHFVKETRLAVTCIRTLSQEIKSTCIGQLYNEN